MEIEALPDVESGTVVCEGFLRLKKSSISLPNSCRVRCIGSPSTLSESKVEKILHHSSRFHALSIIREDAAVTEN